MGQANKSMSILAATISETYSQRYEALLRAANAIGTCSDCDAAADALQEAYVRIWEKAGEFDPAKGSPLAWMATIARNRALDEIRRVRPVSLEDMPEGFEPAAEEVDPLGARDRSERLSALMNCLQALDEEKREAIMLAYYRGFSREALAQRMKRPVPTIKTWLRRGLAQLRDCLA